MRVKRILLTGFGSGYLPYAPGTWGSLVGIILFYVAFKIHFVLGVILWLFLIAFPWKEVEKMEDELGKDPQIIVIDEMLGVSIPMFFFRPEWIVLLAVFLFFRFFDILKPAGIKYLQKYHGAAGVIFDDLLAGIYTLASIWILKLSGIL